MGSSQALALENQASQVRHPARLCRACISLRYSLMRLVAWMRFCRTPGLCAGSSRNALLHSGTHLRCHSGRQRNPSKSWPTLLHKILYYQCPSEGPKVHPTPIWSMIAARRRGVTQRLRSSRWSAPRKVPSRIMYSKGGLQQQLHICSSHRRRSNPRRQPGFRQ